MPLVIFLEISFVILRKRNRWNRKNQPVNTMLPAMSRAEMEAERDRWKAIAEKRHEILRNLEWSSYDHDDEEYGSYCPCCTSMDDEAHVAGCKMAEAIAESSRAASGGQCYPFSTQTCDNPGCTCRAEKRDARAANERGEG